MADDVTPGTDAVAAVVEPKKERAVGRAMAEACEAARMEAAATVEASAAPAHDHVLPCELDYGHPTPRSDMINKANAERPCYVCRLLLRFHEIDRGELEQES